MRAAMFVLAAGLALPSAGTRAADPPKGWDFIGVTQAAAVVDVRARVTGHLTKVAVREGDAVKRGDLLAEIDPRSYRLDLDAARARMLVAHAKFQGAKLKTANANRLMKDKVISQDDLALTRAAEAEAEAGIMAVKVEVQRAELTLSWTLVTAPFDGKVSRIQAAEGGLVVADRTHILTVVSTAPLYVTLLSFTA